MIKEENASARVRVYPSTYKRLKVRGAELGWTMAQLIDYAESTMTVEYRKIKPKRS